MSVPDIGVIAGTPNTGLENSEAFVREVDPMLYFYETDYHPIVSKLLTTGMTLGYRENSNLPKITGKALRKQATKNVKFEHLEDQVELAEKYNATAAVATGDTSLTVSTSDDDKFIAGDVLLLTNASGQTERVRIASVATSTLNIVNADGTTRTAGIVMTTADEFYKMEYARAEDSTSPAIRTTKRAEIYNYVEYISESYGLTKIKKAQADYNGDPLMLEKRKAFSRFMRKLEKMFFFGTRAVANSTTNPIYQSGGLKYFMELYSDVEIRDMAGLALTRAELNSWLTSVLKGGSTTKWLVCDARTLAAINNMGYSDVANSTQTYRMGEFGMNIKKIFGPFGEVELVYEPLFDVVAPFRGSMMLLDPANIKYRYLAGNGENLDVKDIPQILADGASTEKGTYEGVAGFQFSTLKHMGWMKNVGA